VVSGTERIDPDIEAQLDGSPARYRVSARGLIQEDRMSGRGRTLQKLRLRYQNGAQDFAGLAA